MDVISPRFARREAAGNAAAFIVGVLSSLQSKNCWTIAELSGHRSPDRLQHVLSRAKWDADDVRRDLQALVVDAFGSGDAILVVDETGDLKKGTKTVGVQRQYTGTAGRIENSQVAVYLAYAGSGGYGFLDRALYLPQSWTDDPTRCAQAGVPADIEFATKPALAAGMIADALDAGVPACWVAGDEVYGADPTLRTMLPDRKIGYVLGVAANRTVPTAGGDIRVDELADGLRARAWRRLSAGDGATGRRWYSWARVATTETPDTGTCTVLVGRNDRTGELAYYRCYTPHPVALTALVRVAGRRWIVEESFQSSKGLTGLEEHQVRTWTSWHRWTILVMLAHAFLAVATAEQRTHDTADRSLIRLSVNEFRRLFIALLLPPTQSTRQLLRWSHWRRRHQKRAQQCHQKHRATTQ
ncbi:IS701 family transposase [Gordonia sp. TBRC 11910]|uniref:IS701 family transposase n=1 Tax=Gordonia asplenii TaxID=2725283 RepID=A0A848KXS4_9ACTN|nr:IS701 family transposase [Gordonia asplenii]NMO03406.1 IS701 family transposase [Gordonia asplenii]